MKELHNQFKPVSKYGDRLMEHEGNLLLWQYSPDGHDTTVPRIAVGKPPGHPDQYIIGQPHSIAEMAQAFNILDSLGYGAMRAMNVTVSPYLYSRFNEEERERGEREISKTVRQFGVNDTYSDSIYVNGDRGDLSPDFSIGVMNDVRYPYFVMYDFTTLQEGYNQHDFLTRPVFYAAVIAHEWAHVEQFRRGLPSYSLWAERHAISEEAKVLELVLSSGMTLDAAQKKDIENDLRVSSKIIYNYRNGRGFEGHVRERSLLGSPVVDQGLHKEDYQYGR